jgi:hypothetical protein
VGGVAGFVFLITKAGDLKPARLAHVALLYVHQKGMGSKEEFPPSAGWQHTLDQFHAASQYAALDTRGMSDGDICRARLQFEIDALKSTVGWAATEKKQEQVHELDADEEGHFRANALPPGNYSIAVWGQAGMNLALGEQDGIVVGASETVSIKLSSPKLACLQP